MIMRLAEAYSMIRCVGLECHHDNFPLFTITNGKESHKLTVYSHDFVSRQTVKDAIRVLKANDD